MLPPDLQDNNASQLVAGLDLGVWRAQLEGLSRQFTALAQVAGDSFGAIVREIGTFVSAMALASASGESFGQSLEAIRAGKKTEGFAGMGTSLVGVAAAFMQATSSGNAFSKMLKGAAIGAQLGAQIAGPLGAVIGGAAGGVLGLFRSIFGSGEADKVARMRTEFIAAAGGIEQLNRRAREAGVSLSTLFSTKKISDFEREAARVNAQLQLFADEQAADAARLEEAIKKYGFAFEELGPKFQQQNLDGQAKELIEDWRVLVASGIDLTLVNEKMASAINAYLQTALKTGAEIPVAFQPILQSLVNQGLLLDANGVAVTSLGELNIKWAETMTAGFDRVVAKLQELIDRLNSAGQAIDNIPTTVDVTVKYHVEHPPQLDIPPMDVYTGPDPRYLPGGEFYGPSFHTGGYVTAHAGMYLGSGLKAGEVMVKALTGEGVLNRGATAELGGKAGIDAANAGNWDAVWNGMGAIASGQSTAPMLAESDRLGLTGSGGLDTSRMEAGIAAVSERVDQLTRTMSRAFRSLPDDLAAAGYARG
jgi:hypothetical protein